MRNVIEMPGVGGAPGRGGPMMLKAQVRIKWLIHVEICPEGHEYGKPFVEHEYEGTLEQFAAICQAHDDDSRRVPSRSGKDAGDEPRYVRCDVQPTGEVTLPLLDGTSIVMGLLTTGDDDSGTSGTVGNA